MSGDTLTGFPLSPQQRRLWRLAERAGAAPFAAACRLHLEGPLAPEALRAALEQVAARHEILRTRFQSLPGMALPVQVPLAAGDAAAAPRWRAAPAPPPATPVPLIGLSPAAQASPLAATLASDGADATILDLELPALCADAGTLENLVAELAAAYGEAVRDASGDAETAPAAGGAGVGAAAYGEPADGDGGDGEAEPLTYAQFAEWQNDQLAGEDAEAGRAFWREPRLAAVPPPRLPVTAEAPPEAFAPAALRVDLDAAAAERVAAAAAAAGVATERYLLAAWAVLLWRYTGCDDLVLGRLAAGRDHELLRAAFGPIARLLPERVGLAPDLPYGEILRRVTAWQETTEEWQDSFAFTDAWPDEAAAVVAAYSWEEPAAVPPPAAGVRFTVQHLAAQVERCELLLAARHAGGALTLDLRYDAARLSAADVAGLGCCLTSLLASAAANPDRPIGELALLTAEQERTITVSWRADASTASTSRLAELPLHRLLEAQAALTPERFAVAPLADAESAVLFGAGDALGLTFGQLNERANRLARCLRRRGVGPETPVGLLLPRSGDQLVALWAVMKAGGACLPLDSAAPPARLAGLLAAAGAPVALVAAGQGDPAPAGAGGARLLDLASLAAEMAGEDAADLPDGAALENLAYVIFTSGSTGRPKGVLVEHRAVLDLARALAGAIGVYGEGRPLRVSVNAPLTFDASVKQWVQLLAGHTLQLVPEEVRLDAPRCVEFLRRQRVDVLDCTPSQLRPLLAAGLGSDAADPRAVLVGGEAIDAALWSRMEQVESAGPTRFYNVYGPTECTVDTTARSRAGAGPRPTLGGALAGAVTLVVDRLRLPDPVPVPGGFAGELWVGGSRLARGYLGQPDATADRFRPDPWATVPGARVYRTGDLVRRLAPEAPPEPGAGDQLEFLGRADRQIKVRGFRIELEEIEAALASHPAVRQAVVVVVPPAGADGGGAQLAAYVALRTAEQGSAADGRGGASGGVGGITAPGAGDLRGWLRERLPEPMVPAFVVTLPELPMTARGKVDHRALPDARQAAAARAAVAYTAPRNQAERTVAAVWQEVLGVPVVGVDDNFFDLGGHSLLMVRAHGRLQEELGRPLSMVEMFRFTTVGGLAEYLVGGQGDELSLAAVRARAGNQRQGEQRQRRAARRPFAAPEPAPPAAQGDDGDEVTR